MAALSERCCWLKSVLFLFLRVTLECLLCRWGRVVCVENLSEFSKPRAAAGPCV